MTTSPSLRFHLPPPDLHLDRCVNARHRQAGCRLCIDYCPVDALSLATGPHPLPIMDDEACIGCGLCIPICPTDVFSQAMQPETTLISFQEDMPREGVMALACAQHPEPEQTPAPADYVIHHTRCLAAFSIEQLLTLSRNGERALWLSDEICGDCPIGRAHTTIEQLVEGSNQVLTGFGLHPAIHLTSSIPQSSEPSPPKPVLPSNAPALDRRGFFRSIGKLAQQRLDAAEIRAARPMLAPGAPIDQRLPYHVPHSLQQINEHLMVLADTGAPNHTQALTSEALPWADVQLHVEACSGCQLCARFCPTGALNYLWGEMEEGMVFNITFHPRLCLDCNICVAVCPENALNLVHAVTLADLLDTERQLLIADYLVPCERCGTLTRPRPGEEDNLCYVCRGPTMYRQHAQRAYLENLARELLDEQQPTDADEKI